MYWVVGLLLAEPLDARHVAKLLRDRGVDTRPFFYPLHKQPMLSKYSLDTQPSLPVAERLGNQGLYLPSFVGITDDEVSFCAQQLIASLRELQP